MNLGKVVFDPGHINGVNIDPKYPDYSEGTAMFELATMLNNDTGSPLTRGAYERPPLEDRAAIAKRYGANTLISLHTNYPTLGTIIYYSVKRPQDKAIAEQLGQAIADALGIKFRGAVTYPGKNDNDYYGIIRYGVEQGIEHAFLVEHGAHAELAIDTKNKLKKIAQVYKSLLFMEESEMKIKVVPSNPPDTWLAMGIARYIDGELSYVPDVKPNDICVQLGGLGEHGKLATPTAKLIVGTNMIDTAEQAIAWAKQYKKTGKIY
ncbi:N-acetylmuramoyl-L-alanine amidase [Oxobacter pfennigii]|uniref:N-acetylmuramoyl-L-alanine amidase n=1 Tax=Oxobacter pfennigii TaxID=36849 RepID=A0A0P8YRE3_9CLOT|nr:N-acetylmuramoyl-L-alanine amidase [Oxobacter pfennigii]KPU42140.1 N-acetylmuramoyl-L-alanine amidase [Oxobacter pfennigii]